ncbi:hypothetical protein [Clostridium sp. OS1-26]|uniref:hypothetical protein n=1 Tax=Clostridium sp. OS1-26 TaxID=3070681 RepID=UPI0027E197C1|nr:hypothetical protein [Clostridium sp. OS1-26]WML35379.1 hypothetical protein RCG18_01050 [Clostridium sp. OS1-26]
MNLISTSTNEDLRDPKWKMIDYNTVGDTTTVIHQDTKTGKKFKSITKFTGYDDAFGNPVIRHQELYEL